MVTGGARGIGLATARRLLELGMCVGLGDIDEEGVEEATDQLGPHPNVLGVHLDVSSEESVARGIASVVEAFGGLGALINNAGICDVRPLEEVDLDTWQRVLDVNLTGSFLCIKAALPSLTASKGVIINVASTAGLRGAALLAPYCAAKFGVIGLTQSLAEELGPSGVRVNAVCPGTLAHTVMGRGVWHALETHLERSAEELLNQRVQEIPLRRLAEEGDVVEAITFLLSDASSYLSGVSLPVDGGALGS
jgi:NAD(P)-dependent dehydrogenase (short-subunit alcohol dehydrogenase family)